jgi:diaminohydroxyphosphoribosylaminopyrimidine deaminase/5-amino-6-(5-phosphoribosylamino)uracil reductase
VNIHEKYIKRCIEIAENGLGSTAPNPMVGCVIVYNEQIIGEGFTSPYGGPHAEINAINAVDNKSLLKDATLYVTLEPCSHHGKTPPCSELIIKYEIPRVVIGCKDDNPKVSGKGIEKLKKAGSDIILGVLESECKNHHRRFFTFHNKKRPYIILKWAQTEDGYISPLKKNKKRPVWITNKQTKQLVHKWRAEEQGILVGAKTVIDDNPSLTVREYKGRNPVRIIIDKNKSLSKDYTVFDKSAKTIVLSQDQLDFSKPLASQICHQLYKLNIISIIIEGGKKTLQAFIKENIWDEARVLTGATTFKKGLEAPNINGRFITETKFKSDILKIYLND